MENKIKYIIISFVAIIIVISGVLAFTLGGNQEIEALEPLENTGLVKSEYEIKFYSDGSQSKSIQSEVEKLRTNPHLKDEINNETIKWIESFDNNEYVVVSSDTVNFIMKRSDYDVLKSKINTSELSSSLDPIEYIKATINANMIETHNLGSGYKDVVYIDSIELVNTIKTDINKELGVSDNY